MSIDVIDETDYYAIPDFLISWDWVKKAYPKKYKDFELVEYYFIHGYTIVELSEMHNLQEWYIKRIIKETLELVKHEMTK